MMRESLDAVARLVKERDEARAVCAQASDAINRVLASGVFLGALVEQDLRAALAALKAVQK